VERLLDVAEHEQRVVPEIRVTTGTCASVQMTSIDSPNRSASATRTAIPTVDDNETVTCVIAATMRMGMRSTIATIPTTIER